MEEQSENSGVDFSGLEVSSIEKYESDSKDGQPEDGFSIENHESNAANSQRVAEDDNDFIDTEFSLAAGSDLNKIRPSVH